MTIQEFGQKIKTKYPDYADMDDVTLGQKMLTKYPQYKDMVSDVKTIAPQKQTKTLAQKAGEVNNAVGNFLGMGALGKGIGLTAFKYLSPEGRDLTKKVETGKANQLELEAYSNIFGEAPTAKQTIGSALQTATMFVPVGKIGNAVSGAKTASQAFIKGAIKAAVPAAATGAVYGAGQAMQDEKNTTGILKGAAIGGVTSGIVSGIMGGLFTKSQFNAPQKAAQMREKAIDQYQKGLQATKEKYKEKANRIIPELLDQGVWGKFSDLKKKAEKGVALSMEEYQKLGELKGIADTDGIDKVIADEMRKYITPGGSVISVNQGKFKALQGLAEDIKSLKSDGVVENEELRKLAQQYGNVLYESRKAQKTIGDNATLSQVKKVDGAIRGLLNDTNPDYAKINKVYHLNSELQDILLETANRKAPQKWISLLQGMLGGAGMTVGGVTGGAAGAVGWGLALGGYAKIMESTWFNTLSAVQKNKAAQKLMQLPLQDMNRRINLIAAGGTKAMLEFLSANDKNK